MICAALLALGLDIAPTAAPVCEEVVDAAEAYHLPPAVLVSIAWHESRLWPDVVHPESGAAGPLQVMPSLQTGDLVDDGARIFREWLDHEAQACVEIPTVDELGASTLGTTYDRDRRLDQADPIDKRTLPPSTVSD